MLSAGGSRAEQQNEAVTEQRFHFHAVENTHARRRAWKPRSRGASRSLFLSLKKKRRRGKKPRRRRGRRKRRGGARRYTFASPRRPLPRRRSSTSLSFVGDVDVDVVSREREKSILSVPRRDVADISRAEKPKQLLKPVLRRARGVSRRRKKRRAGTRYKESMRDKTQIARDCTNRSCREWFLSRGVRENRCDFPREIAPRHVSRGKIMLRVISGRSMIPSGWNRQNEFFCPRSRELLLRGGGFQNHDYRSEERKYSNNFPFFFPPSRFFLAPRNFSSLSDVL